MVATQNPWAAREYVHRRLQIIKLRPALQAERDRAHLALMAEIDSAIGHAIATGEEAQLAAFESAKEYLREKLNE